jgi:hypothetical protein
MSFNGINQYVASPGYLSQDLAPFNLGVLPVAQDPSASFVSNSADLNEDLSQQNVATLANFVIVDAPQPSDDLVADIFKTIVVYQSRADTRQEETELLLLKSIEHPSSVEATSHPMSDTLEDYPKVQDFS